jgi:hypothetical protein
MPARRAAILEQQAHRSAGGFQEIDNLRSLIVGQLVTERFDLDHNLILHK